MLWNESNAIMQFLIHGHLQSMLLTLPRDGQVVVSMKACVFIYKINSYCYLSNV
jgi:cytochrome c551/c552